MSKKVTTKTNYSLLIANKSVYRNSIFIDLLGAIEGLNIKELPKHVKPKIKFLVLGLKINKKFYFLFIFNDCRLFYNHKYDTYTLSVPIDVKCKTITNREEITAIDPGEKNFIYFHGLRSHGYIGKDMRYIILKLRNKISRYQKIKSKGKNKNGKKLRNKKHINKKISNIYNQIRNIVKELHNQSANYLCKNYDKILLPKFETQKMVSNKKSFKEYKKDFINEGKTIEEKKQKAKYFTKKTRLNKNVKYVLNTLSHYKFR